MNKKIKVVIADDNADISNLLREYLGSDSDLDIVGVAKNGVETLSMVKSEKPDVLLLVIIVYSAISHDKVTNTAITLGADYYMVKGIDLKHLKKRIKSYFMESEESVDHLEAAGNPDSSQNGEIRADLATELSGILQEAGILPHIKGYSYLREAITEVIDNVDLLSAVTKELYPNIANKFNTTSSRVERAIRHSIEVSWNRGHLDNLNNISGYNVNFEKGKPTNSEFIALISDKFRLRKSSEES